MLQGLGVSLLVLSTPLALGGEPAAARALLIVVTVGLLVLRMASPSRPTDRSWLAVWAVLVALVAIQLLPLPEAVAARLGAHPDALHSFPELAVTRISPMPLATGHYAAIFTSYWVLAWLVSGLPRRQVSWVVTSLMAVAFLEAFYGTHALARGSETILGLWPRRDHIGDATGTYLNRNHFAGLLALSWPVATAHLAPFGQSRGIRLPVAIRTAGALLFSLLVGTAIVASHSRAGLLAAVVGLAAWLALERGGRHGRATRRLAWFLGAIGAVGALWFGASPMLDRFLMLQADVERFMLWSALFELPARTWILGAGAGSFADVFKTVQPATLQASWGAAHNDWLEFVLGFGLVGSAAVVLVLAHWWLRVRPRHWTTLQKAAAGGITAIAFHSLFDFDLQLPGTAVAFWVLVGIVANAGLSFQRREVGHAG